MQASFPASFEECGSTFPTIAHTLASHELRVKRGNHVGGLLRIGLILVGVPIFHLNFASSSQTSPRILR